MNERRFNSRRVSSGQSHSSQYQSPNALAHSILPPPCVHWMLCRWEHSGGHYSNLFRQLPCAHCLLLTADNVLPTSPSHPLPHLIRARTHSVYIKMVSVAGCRRNVWEGSSLKKSRPWDTASILSAVTAALNASSATDPAPDFHK